jgi:hypothetical protein
MQAQLAPRFGLYSGTIMFALTRLLLLGVLALVGPGVAHADESVGGAARNFGRAVRDAGKAIGQGAKEVGRQTKGPAKQVGHGFRDGAVAVGHGFRDGFGKGARPNGGGRADGGKRGSSAKAKRPGTAQPHHQAAPVSGTATDTAAR